MRTFLIVLVSMTTLACTQQSKNDQQKTQDVVKNLIVANDPTACASPEAISTVFSIVSSGYGQAMMNGMPPISVRAISATGVNNDIHEISCSARGHSRSPYSDVEQSFALYYKLRPALDQEGFVADVLATPIVKERIATHIFWWNSQNNQTQSTPVPNDDVQPAISDSTTSGKELEQDTCDASVLRDVAAVEDPSSKMKAGELWSDVTQYWRDSRTGEAKFCAHGGYCYPTHVRLKDQKVEAIRLNNCSIRDRVNEYDGQTLYGVR